MRIQFLLVLLLLLPSRLMAQGLLSQEELSRLATKLETCRIDLANDLKLPAGQWSPGTPGVSGAALVIRRDDHLAIITAHRAVAGAKKLTLRRSDGRTTIASVGVIDLERGLASLQVEDVRFLGSIPAIPMGEMDFRIAQLVFMFAARPEGASPDTLPIRWAHHQGFAAEPSHFYVRPGMGLGPGEPLVDAGGRLVALGIGTALPGGEGEYLAIPAAHIQSFLRSKLKWPDSK